MSKAPNPVNLNKLPGSKWTAARPVRKEKHFIVLGWVLDADGQRTDEVEIEAVLTRCVRRVHWRGLADPEAWRIGWR